MKILWLGQGGLLFVSGKTKVIIDPYLSNALYEYDRKNFARGMKINKKIFRVKPDALILTNNHSDHADIHTIERLARHRRNRSSLTILSCESVFQELINASNLSQANHVMLEPGSEWTIDTINILAVTAKTDDKTAIGVIITDTQTNEKYYVAGDTLYSKHVLNELPKDIYAAFVPIGGKFGCMNIIDAKRFAKETMADFVVPVHFGMFDKINPADLALDNLVIPKIYKIINFEGAEALAIKNKLDRKFNEKQEETIEGDSEPEIEIEIEIERDDSVAVPVLDNVPNVVDTEMTPSLEEEIISQAKAISFDDTFTNEVEIIKSADCPDLDSSEEAFFFADSEEEATDPEEITLEENNFKEINPEEIDEAVEIIEGAYAIEDTEEIEDIEIAEDIEEIEDVEIVEDIEEIEDIEIVEDVEEIEDVNEIEEIEIVEEIEDIEIVEDVEEIEDVEIADDSESLEVVIDTEEIQDELDFDSDFSAVNDDELSHWENEEEDDLDAIIALNDDFFDDIDYELEDATDADNIYDDIDTDSVREADTDIEFNEDVDEYLSHESTSSRDEDDSQLIDAYIREIEKFERGETSDFARPKGLDD